jgi:hypothetical protein
MDTSVGFHSKSFAQTLAIAIIAGCLRQRDIALWADKIIENCENPPVWICELSATKHNEDVLRVIGDFIESDPFDAIKNRAEDFLGFDWIRYERREISWATFLTEAEDYSTVYGAIGTSEYFLETLNEFEGSEFDLTIESQQREAVRQHLGEAVTRTRKFYDEIRQRG